MPKTLNNLRKYLFVFLVVGAPLSFVPSLATPLLNFSSFRIGLYQIVAAVFVAITLLPLYQKLDIMFKKQIIPYTLLTIFALTSLISLFFTTNTSRGILLTTSVMFLIAIVFCAWWFVAYQLKNIPKIFVDIFLWSGVFFAGLAILQLIYGTYFDSGGFLCKGCKSAIFGFPRVNATAAEPLFFANALLPVLLTSFYLSLKKYKLAYFSLFATALTIGLTFARGAYLAAGVGVLVILIASLVSKRGDLKDFIKPLAIIILAGFVALSLLTASATIRFYGTTPNITYNTVQSMADHLTLGVIQLPDKEIVVIQAPANNDPSDDFESPGLIEASTNERLGSAELAIDAWLNGPKNLFIGTGLGNLGPYVVANISAGAPDNLTVYIFYVLVLAELGLFGLISFATLLGFLVYKLAKNINRPIVLITLAILTAFITQYFFFGSYINVVYIWLYIGIALGILSNIKLDFQGIMLGNAKKAKVVYEE